MFSNAALSLRYEPVPQTDIGKRSAHHHFMIAPARAIGIEILGFHAPLLQIFTRRAGSLDGAGRRDMVGGHAMAKFGQHTRSLDVLDWRGPGRHVVKVRSALDVSRGC